jgi:UTP:GlnB (protein PII) uridylyltransferase
MRDRLYVLVGLGDMSQNDFGLSILDKAFTAIEETVKKQMAKEGRDFDKEGKAILAAKRATEAARKAAREGKTVEATEPEVKTGKGKK